MKDKRILSPIKYSTVSLIDLCESITDCLHSTPKWTDEGILVIRNYNIKGGSLVLDKPSYTDEETYQERVSRAVPEAGDIIITREAPMGEVCMVPDDLTCCLGQRMVLIKPNKRKVDPKYLLYVLQSEYLQKQIGSSNKTGSIVSNLRIPLLKDLQIPQLGSDQEKALGKILYDIDSKISLNNRSNAELEALAKTIYDYWFVQFDFPISAALAAEMGKPELEGKPYKSSGGAMVWNEKLKREVPKGWEVKKIKDFIKIGSGYSFKSNEYMTEGEYKIITIKNVQDNQLVTDKTDFVNSIPKDLPTYCELELGDILFSLTGNVGRICLVHEDNLLLNQRVGKIIGEKDYRHFFYFFFQRPEERQRLEKIATGSSQKNLSPVQAVDYHFAVPPEETLSSIMKLLNPTIEKIVKNLQQNQELASLRDWLLPMLMNGQVKVGEALKEYVQEGDVGMAADREAEYCKQFISEKKS